MQHCDRAPIHGYEHTNTQLGGGTSIAEEPLRIWLVRHGESEGNVDLDVYRTHADHAIPLSERGRDQARIAGAHLREHLASMVPAGGHVRVWTSP